MTDKLISPDTTLALLKATQAQSADLAKARDTRRIDEAARDFEAMFITEMMKPMFEGIEPDPMFGGGKTEEVFNGLMLQEYGKLMAATGQLGIAEQVKEEMIRLQEEANGTDQSEQADG